MQRLFYRLASVSLAVLAREVVYSSYDQTRTYFGPAVVQYLNPTESLLLVGAGGALGCWFAVIATSALAQWSDLDVRLAPDRTVLLFTGAISLIVALIFGLTPLRGVTRFPAGLALKSSSPNAT